MYECIYVSTYVCMYICMHVPIYVHMIFIIYLSNIYLTIYLSVLQFYFLSSYLSIVLYSFLFLFLLSCCSISRTSGNFWIIITQPRKTFISNKKKTLWDILLHENKIHDTRCSLKIVLFPNSLQPIPCLKESNSSALRS